VINKWLNLKLSNYAILCKISLVVEKMHPILKKYIPIMELIGNTFGKNCEVVLHDFSDPQHSIVNIINGNVTGRKIGDSITDLALEAWRRDGFGANKERMLLNYQSKSKDGKVLKSSTLFIEEEKGNIIGCLCINYDLTEGIMLSNFFNDLCQTESLTMEREDTSETFVEDINEVLDYLVDKAISEVGRPVALMSKEEKVRTVSLIDEKGGFLIKGAIDKVAKSLNVSRYTIYNYLEEAKAMREEGLNLI
jgi:predicted transcriptional regulator YheO